MEHINSIFPFVKILSERIEKRANQLLQQYAVTFSQIRILMVLYYYVETSCSMKELERIFHVSQQTIAGTVSRLEKKGLIVSFSHPEDKRIKKVMITDKGRQLSVDAEKIILEMEENEFSGLTDEEQKIFLSLLQKICNTCK